MDCYAEARTVQRFRILIASTLKNTISGGKWNNGDILSPEHRQLRYRSNPATKMEVGRRYLQFDSNGNVSDLLRSAARSTAFISWSGKQVTGIRTLTPAFPSELTWSWCSPTQIP